MVNRRQFLTLTATGVGVSLCSVSVDQRTVDLNLRPQPLRGSDVTTLSGRTSVSSASLSDAVHIIFVGQSTNSNALTGTPSTLANQNSIFNMSIAHRGACFIAQNPLLSSDITGGHHGLYLADSLIANGLAPKVILTNIICGGNYFSDWVGSGELAYRIGLAARCVANAGLSNLPTIIDHQGGEWDSDISLSEANATAQLNGIIAEFKRVGLLRTGNAMFVHQNTRRSNTSGQRAGTRAGQLAVRDGTFVRGGVDIDTLGDSYRSDGTHFTEVGGVVQAALKYPLYVDFLTS